MIKTSPFFFFSVKLYFTELYYLNLLLFNAKKRRQLQVPLKSQCFYWAFASFTCLFFDLLKNRQTIFFTTSSRNFVSQKMFYNNFSQRYADRKANFWGLTNRKMLQANIVSKGLEARFKNASGLVLNTSPLFTAKIPFRYLWRSENLLSSVNLIKNIDYPLFSLSFSKKTDRFFFDFFHQLGNAYLSQNNFILQSLLIANLKKKQFKFRRQQQRQQRQQFKFRQRNNKLRGFQVKPRGFIANFPSKKKNVHTKK